ncbi:Hypothetical protein ETEE_3568 [Edwardsiella anguillarum ET080813]|uniref:Uncharacterized protein n=1 Tax=Edwardsiella anguillarum ET080813 TaxID=667120 RepID=A0A076LU43_9GAMM|nr:Hypothetical protein ETEE_3568 [Edwardsiella anguillarum ET080813]
MTTGCSTGVKQAKACAARPLQEWQNMGDAQREKRNGKKAGW